MKKIKAYLQGVWLIDLIIILGLTIYLVKNIIFTVPSGITNIDFNVFKVVKNEDKFISDFFESRTLTISSEIYRITNYFNSKEDKEKELLELEGNTYGAYFLVRDKLNDRSYSNNPSLLSQLDIDSNVISSEEIINRLKSRGYIVYYIDNKKNHNLVMDIDGGDQKEEKQLENKNIEEFYFDSYRYIDQQARIYIDKAYFIVFLSGILILFIIKVIANLILNPKNVHLKSRIIMDYVYVFKNGLRFKYPRRMLITTAIITALGIIVYLYSLVDGNETTFFENLLTTYPFKSILVISIVPILVVGYMIKDNIDLCMLNEKLNKISKGDLDIDITQDTREDVKELVEHVNDIKTGYKIMLEDKVRDEKLKTELISNVSHDLKTPLTSIINYIQILKSDDLTDDERRDYVQIIDNKSQRLKVLIDDLFEMSKLNSGKIILDKTDIDVVSLIYQVIGENSYLYEEKNLSFKVNSDFEECILSLDGSKFSRVIENIIVNAIKYSIENTRIYVDIINKGDKVLLSFKNISNYEMNFDNKEIFERFVRGERSRTSSIEGSGIGLSIAKSIIELHNGEINISVEGDMFKIFILLDKNNDI